MKFKAERFYVEDYALSIGIGRDTSRIGSPWALYGRIGPWLFTLWPKYGNPVQTNTPGGPRYA